MERWALLTYRAVNAAKLGAIGAYIKRFERRWHRLGVELRRSRLAGWFRNHFLTPDDRRAWWPTPFRWWAGGHPWGERRVRRSTTQGGRAWVYDPDVEGGPDPDPWWDWPHDPLQRAREVD